MQLTVTHDVDGFDLIPAGDQEEESGAATQGEHEGGDDVPPFAARAPAIRSARSSGVLVASSRASRRPASFQYSVFPPGRRLKLRSQSFIFFRCAQAPQR